MQALLKQTTTILEMIKFQHTIFALPFALTAMIIAAHGLPDARIIFWIIAACVFARTAAMSFNRWADRHLDSRNPRTATRAIPAGQLSARFVLIFTILSTIGFIVSAGMLNTTALLLSPIALVILLGYSYTKRFTSLAHFVLGMALALAPMGAWIAVSGSIHPTAILLGIGVMLWTAGFDLIYACQDVEIDRNEGLHSIPSRIGAHNALRLSRLLHVLAIASFLAAGQQSQSGVGYYAGITIAAILLIAEHIIVSPHDLKRINIAFFTINSWVGMAILAGTVIDQFLVRR